MRRYTDFFVMLAILVLDFLVALFLWNTVDTSGSPNSADLSYSIMRLAMVAIPGIALAAGLAFGRGIWNLRPRSFYLVTMTGAILSALLTWVSALAMADAESIVSLNNAVFSIVILAVAALVGLILGLTGAVPSPAKKAAPVLPKDEADTSELTADVDEAATRGEATSSDFSFERDDSADLDETSKLLDSQTATSPDTSFSTDPRTVLPEEDDAQ